MFCFESKHTALRALLSNTLTQHAPFQALYYVSKMLLFQPFIAARINFKEIIKVNPRQHLQLQNTQEATTFKLDSITFSSKTTSAGPESPTAQHLLQSHRLLCKHFRVRHIQSRPLRSDLVRAATPAKVQATQHWIRAPPSNTQTVQW